MAYKSVTYIVTFSVDFFFFLIKRKIYTQIFVQQFVIKQILLHYSFWHSIGITLLLVKKKRKQNNWHGKLFRKSLEHITCFRRFCGFLLLLLLHYRPQHGFIRMPSLRIGFGCSTTSPNLGSYDGFRLRRH